VAESRVAAVAVAPSGGVVDARLDATVDWGEAGAKNMTTLERQLLDKLSGIEERLDKLEKKGKKRNLSFEACVPPLYLCREIVFDGDLGNFDNQMQQLADYYGIAPMGNFHNPARVPKNAIACYHAFDSSASYKEPNTNIGTVLHEFFHHLHAQGVVCLNGKSEEKLADKFSKLVMGRGATEK